MVEMTTYQLWWARLQVCPKLGRPPSPGPSDVKIQDAVIFNISRALGLLGMYVGRGGDEVWLEGEGGKKGGFL